MQAERHHDTVAATFNGAALSYGELNERANRLAHYLRCVGVGPEVLVGLCMERSLEMVVGLLGILKAGGAAYLPLDPTYPRERLEWMLSDSRTPVILTRDALRDRLSSDSRTIVCIDREESAITRAPSTNLEDGRRPGSPRVRHLHVWLNRAAQGGDDRSPRPEQLSHVVFGYVPDRSRRRGSGPLVDFL